MRKLKEIKNWNLLIIVVFIVIFCITIFLSFRGDSNSWTNFWQVIGAILGVVGAILAIVYERREEDKVRRDKKRKDAHFELKDLSGNVDREIIPLLFELEKDDKIDDSRRHNYWVMVLSYKVRAGDITSRLSDLLNDESGHNHLSDANYDFSDVLLEIERLYNLPENKEIVDGIIDKYDHFPSFDNKSEESKDFRDNYVKVSWILKREYAEKAKYLVGVSTKDKRIMRIFKLEENGVESQDENTKRITFASQKTLYSANELEKGRAIYLDELKEWRSSNPVLYFKAFLEANNLPYSKILDKYLEDGDTYQNLDPREIIVVRTRKFDEE